MENRDFEKAKLIFEKYDGSHFHMEREGEYTEYKIYNVPKEVERQWLETIKEKMRSELIFALDENKITSLFYKLSELISRSIDKNGLLYLIEYAQCRHNKLDSFSNIMLAEAILNAVGSFDVKNNKSTVRKVLKLLRKTAQTEFRVADCYKENDMLQDCLTEEKIAERIQRNIEYWEKELSAGTL